ncbi:MFS transporter [Candidatus Pacearchaeota archaeon]|nr:MFS transporter [Candidatus Pacearchaeota archaeon]
MVKKSSVKELKHQARRLSIKEGMFATAKGSFGERYISPFAIAINASNSAVALLSSITGLLGPLSQMFSSKLMEKYSRKKIILKAVFIESLMWLPLILIAILYYKGILISILPFFLLFFFGLYILIANIGGPAWFSWMGDLVDKEYRGRWFSKRTLILGFVSIVLALSASFFLNYFKNNNWTMFGFMILFALAFIFRMMSWNVFKKQYEPKIKLKKGYYFSFWDFLVKSPKTNFGKFSIFRALLAFAGSISTPLLAVYLLRHLEFDYITYMIVILSGSVFSIAIIKIWGNFADKYGNYKVLAITSLLIPIIPILWILSPSPIYMVLVPSLISGISWAGFGLSSGNFIYDNVTNQKRGLAVSYYNMLIGIGIFFGAGLGALLIKYLTISFIEPLFFIFLLSGIARMVVVFNWIPKIKEIRKTEKLNGKKALKNLIFKQVKSTLFEEVHEIMSIKKYLRSK